MGDIPLRIAQTSATTTNIDGTPGTTSPDIQYQLDIPDAYDDTALQADVTFAQDQAQAALNSAALANTTAGTAFSTATGALSTANGAQITANGKSVVYYLATTPATPPAQDGDIWFDTSNDNLPHKHVSGSWLSTPLGNNAIIGNLDAGKITAGTLSGIIITGNTVQTTTGYSVGGSVKSVVISAAAQDRITFYTGAGAAEHAAPFISGQVSGSIGTLRISGPALGALAATTVDLTSTAISGSTVNAVIVTAQAMWLSSGVNFYCDAFLDLTNQTNSGFFQSSTGTGVGDKIGLFGSGHGIGIGASKTAIYVGSSANVSIMDGTLTSPRSNSTGYRPILASAFTVSSLESTKTRIKTMPDGALDKLMRLRPVIARSHNDTHLPDSMRDRPWLVAEEVAQVDRSLAAHQMTEAWSDEHMHKEKPPKSGESDVELVGVDLMQVVALQIKAIQELLVRVEAVERG